MYCQCAVRYDIEAGARHTCECTGACFACFETVPSADIRLAHLTSLYKLYERVQSPVGARAPLSQRLLPARCVTVLHAA